MFKHDDNAVKSIVILVPVRVTYTIFYKWSSQIIFCS